MTKVSDKILAYFAEFDRANNAFAADLIAPYVSDPVIGADPNGAIQVVKKEDYLAGTAQSQAHLRALGFQFVKTIPLEEIPLNAHYTMVKTHGIMHLEKIPGQPIDLTHDTIYILYVKEGSPKLVFTLTHEDPMKMLQEQQQNVPTDSDWLY